MNDNKKVIAVYSEGLEGIEILDVIHGINVYIVWRYTTDKRIHKTKIYGTINGKLYFKANNRRIDLNDCLRIC